MPNIDVLEEATEKLPHSTRKMFGGHGLFAPNGGMFAGIVDDDRIILKFANEEARAEFEAIGGRAWVYNEKMTMKEWILVPDALYDEPRALAAWAARAHKLAPPKKAKAARGPPKKAARKPAKTSPRKAAAKKRR